ncbi:putative HTH-type transcriptional regulator [Calidithermus terrae]|uniref:Putative HTH-type transcriptional regulator n=1 Tax=Calidithermus terrae TaxID=1408545 RepID=A0A399EFI7_9DEIN|nr:tetratricopeptide repeat protein [Calidithermus terrae]RIH81800.1 putative HTH-type transcriptional regulator [Calidithermus terrae]
MIAPQPVPPLAERAEAPGQGRPSLYLLGPAGLERGGERVYLATRKSLALLAYVAAQPGGSARAELAGLLWPDHPEEQARASLRQEVSRLGQTLGEALRKLDPQTLALSREHLWADLWAFEAALEAGELERAVGLYRGPFLQGLQLKGAVGFEEWQAQARERLQQRYLEALAALAARRAEAGRAGEALAYCRQAIAADPLAEGPYLQAMRLLERQGDHAGALRLYQSLEKVLREELGLEPSAEARALLGPARSSLSAPRLPAPPTPLVGRRQEIEDVLLLLQRPDCRLLNLVGPGGIGKTRLALAVAERLREQGQALHWVSLGGGKLVSSLAEALGLPLLGRGNALQALLHRVREGGPWLVLDEAEALEEPGELEVLLRETPSKLLLTSRERLRLHGEWVYEVHGLAVAAESWAVRGSPAAELFRAMAERAKPGFAPAPAEWQAIGRICRQLSGMPLALELAATWVRLMGCEAIAAHLEHDLDLLDGSPGSPGGRHASLKAVLDSTLEALRPEERAALERLAVFRGGFDLETAQQVAQASPALLAALTDRALLQRQEAGFRILEVVRQHLSPRVPAGTRAAHARHFAALLHREAGSLTGGDQHAALRRLSAAGDNLHAAWRWAVAHEPALLEPMSDGVFLLHELRGSFREGVEWFAEAQGLPAPGLQARVLARKGRLLYRLSALGEARQGLERALSLAEAPQERAFCLNNLGLVELSEGHARAAQELFGQSLALRREAGHRWGAANCLYNLGLVALSFGQQEAARQRFQEALEHYRALGDLRGTSLALTGLGQAWTAQGQYGVARELLRQALSLSQQLGDRFSEAAAQLWLGAVAGIERENEECRERLQASLEAAYQTGDPVSIGRALLGLGRLAVRDGKAEQALRLQRQALERFQLGHHPWGEALAYNHLARTYSALGESAESRAHYRLALEQALRLEAAPLALRALAGMTPDLEPPLAAEARRLIAHHPSTDAWVREETRREAGGTLEPPTRSLEGVALEALRVL